MLVLAEGLVELEILATGVHRSPLRPCHMKSCNFPLRLKLGSFFIPGMHGVLLRQGQEHSMTS